MVCYGVIFVAVFANTVQINTLAQYLIMKPFLALLFIVSTFCNAQNQLYPQDYFSNPLDIPIILSGTFAELRSNHFHSGMDIKTQQRIGLKVKAAANGYVSRIKISHYGYGKALYVTHPNGYITVYAHLDKFSPEIESYIKKKQYENESYEIEVFPKANELNVTKDALIAYSGNSGGSGGPHLHFEIRDNAERPINPMLFGINVKDTTIPMVTALYAYPMDESSHVNGSNSLQKIKLIPQPNGDYYTEGVCAFGHIGFGISTWDRQDLGANKNGVSNIQTFANGRKTFELDFKRFSFDETKHINQLIDYKFYKQHKQRIQKLFVDNNALSMYKDVERNGILTVEDSTNLMVKIKVSDFKNNTAWVTLNMAGRKTDGIVPNTPYTTPYFIDHNTSTTLHEGSISVSISPNTFYNDVYLDFKVQNDTLMLHEDIIPMQKSLAIAFNIEKYAEAEKQKLYIAKLYGYNKTPNYSLTKRNGDTLTTFTNSLGEFALAMDTIKPKISALNFKNAQWLSNYRFLKVQIEDEESGISNYRGTINGKWILMAYDYKTKTLTYDFKDMDNTNTKNELKVIVTDNVGNNSTFEATFYRK